jgi:hypothetical protein
VNRLRNRLIAIFLAATLAPLAATIWVTTFLLDISLEYSSTDQLNAIASSLEATEKEFYQRARTDLKQGAASGEIDPKKFQPDGRANWPDAVKAFADGDQPEEFVRAGQEGDRLDYLVRRGGDVWMYSSSLGGVKTERLVNQIRAARALVNQAESHDLRRGFKLFYIGLAVSF